MLISALGLGILEISVSNVIISGGHSCPTTLKPAESTSAPPDWRVWRSDEAKELKLTDVSFADGDPKLRVFITPVAERQKGANRTASFDFRSSSYGKIWIICQYKDTNLTLVQPTDLQGKRCEVVYPSVLGGRASDHVSCR